MIWEHHTKQGSLVQSIVVFDNAITSSGTMEPEARLLDVCRRALAKSGTHHSLCARSRMLIFLRQITQKTTSELLDIKLAFEEDKFTMRDHDQGYALQLVHNHTVLSW